MTTQERTTPFGLTLDNWPIALLAAVLAVGLITLVILTWQLGSRALRTRTLIREQRRLLTGVAVGAAERERLRDDALTDHGAADRTRLGRLYAWTACAVIGGIILATATQITVGQLWGWVPQLLWLCTAGIGGGGSVAYMWLRRRRYVVAGILAALGIGCGTLVGAIVPASMAAMPATPTPEVTASAAPDPSDPAPGHTTTTRPTTTSRPTTKDTPPPVPTGRHMGRFQLDNGAVYEFAKGTRICAISDEAAGHFGVGKGDDLRELITRHPSVEPGVPSLWNALRGQWVEVHAWHVIPCGVSKESAERKPQDLAAPIAGGESWEPVKPLHVAAAMVLVDGRGEVGGDEVYWFYEKQPGVNPPEGLIARSAAVKTQ